ncbi:MAG: FkbM family methyltransferase [Candidatus Sulfotelmatobacter sp.]
MKRPSFSVLANARHAPEIVACFRETEQWLPVTLAYLGLRPIVYPYELQLRTGEVAIFRERTDLVIFWMVFARRHYPVRSSDQVIIDVGANIGLFTLFSARQAPRARILAVEPFPDTRSSLLNLIERNGLSGRVTVSDCAVAASSGTAVMDAAVGVPSQYRRIYAAATTTLNARHRGSPALLQTAEGVPVCAKTLAELLDTVNVATADLVKMNIHGSEYEVLMSAPAAALQRCGRIALQYHELPADLHLGKKELFEHLGRSGFRLVSDRDTQRGSGVALLILDRS